MKDNPGEILIEGMGIRDLNGLKLQVSWATIVTIELIEDGED